MIGAGAQGGTTTVPAARVISGLLPGPHKSRLTLLGTSMQGLHRSGLNLHAA